MVEKIAYIVTRQNTITNRIIVNDEIAFAPPKNHKLVFDSDDINIIESTTKEDGEKITVNRKPDIGEKLE